jgi:alkanesulfonate monooxygenase SsuD/methylene tetrahydromethanopterin reductase-like flavin-dependent oxidoreductase (luciferase family)
MLHLLASLAGYGFHPAAWRVSNLADGPGQLPDHRDLVRRAEAACLDAVLFGPAPSTPGLLETGAHAALAPDPLPQMGALITRTRRIGLAGSVYIGHTEPFHTARAFAVMDNLSSGRTALLADTEGLDQRPADFAHAPRDAAEAYPRAAEYLEVVARLWESWEPDAIQADKPSGNYADGMKVHRIDHAGRFFTVRGPLTAIRAPQGRPVLIQRDASPAGLDLAARTAEVFLMRAPGIAAARAMRADLLARAAACGRPPGAMRVLAELELLLGADAVARAAALDAMTAPEPCPRLIGTAEEVAAEMAEWHAAGACDGFNIRPAVLPDDLTGFLAEVVPRLQALGIARRTYAGAMLRDHLGLSPPPEYERPEAVA